MERKKIQSRSRECNQDSHSAEMNGKLSISKIGKHTEIFNLRNFFYTILFTLKRGFLFVLNSYFVVSI